MIYHNYWLAHPILKDPSTTCGKAMLLHYQYEYDTNKSIIGTGSDGLVLRELPLWMLANKQLLHEALAQFTSKAIWFQNMRYGLKSSQRRASLFDASKIKSMSIFVGDLNRWDDADNLIFKKTVQLIIDDLLVRQRHVGNLQRLRIIGYGSPMPFNTWNGDRFEYLVRLWSHIFRSIDVSCLEIEVHGCSVVGYEGHVTPRKRILYQVIGEGEDADLVVKKSETMQGHRWIVGGPQSNTRK